MLNIRWYTQNFSETCRYLKKNQSLVKVRHFYGCMLNSKYPKIDPLSCNSFSVVNNSNDYDVGGWWLSLAEGDIFY